MYNNKHNRRVPKNPDKKKRTSHTWHLFPLLFARPSHGFPGTFIRRYYCTDAVNRKFALKEQRLWTMKFHFLQFLQMLAILQTLILMAYLHRELQEVSQGRWKHLKSGRARSKRGHMATPTNGQISKRLEIMPNQVHTVFGWELKVIDLRVYLKSC